MEVTDEMEARKVVVVVVVIVVVDDDNCRYGSSLAKITVEVEAKGVV